MQPRLRTTGWEQSWEVRCHLSLGYGYKGTGSRGGVAIQGHTGGGMGAVGAEEGLFSEARTVMAFDFPMGLRRPPCGIQPLNQATASSCRIADRFLSLVLTRIPASDLGRQMGLGL